MTLYFDFMLEEMVAYDMEVAGYDPTDPLDIQAFWESRLS